MPTQRPVSKGKPRKAKAQEPEDSHQCRATVQDSMVWHYQKGYKPEQNRAPVNESGPRDYYLPKKGDLGQAKSRGYNMPPSGPHKEKPDEGTVVEALRGWPGYRQGDKHDEYGFDQEESQNGSGDASKGDDPWMGDLISHKFLYDSVRQRQEQEEAERQAAMTARAKKSGRGKTDIKSNRTSQLRAIAMAEKVEKSPFDLWQMPKFKDNSKAHLTTTKKKNEARNGALNGKYGSRTGSRSGSQAGGYNGDPCTCYDNTEKVDYANYDFGQTDTYRDYDYQANGDTFKDTDNDRYLFDPNYD